MSWQFGAFNDFSELFNTSVFQFLAGLSLGLYLNTLTNFLSFQETVLGFLLDFWQSVDIYK